MNEKPDALSEETPRNGNLSIGQTIRKQRISMNVSIDKISRDLKINKIYVQAIEDDRHDLLPALPYVRGYVRGIAEYLSLDSVKLLKQLSDGDNSAPSAKDDGKQDSEKKDDLLNVSMTEQKKGKNYGFPILLVVLLGVLAYFAMEFGSIGYGTEDDEYVPTPFESFVLHEDNEENEISEGEEPVSDTNGAAATQALNIEISVNVVRDSSAVEIIKDGVLARNRTYARPQRFTETARDSLVLRLGAPAAVELTFNGNAVPRSGTAPTNWLFTGDGNVKTISLAEWRLLRGRATVQ